MTAKPMYFHVRMPISVQIAMFGSASQSVARKPRPMLCSASLTAPLTWSIRLKPVPTMTSEIT